MKKRLTALVCAVVLCLSALPARAINVGDVYFTAVNDWLVPLSVDAMPIWVNGVLYVPASVFDNAVAGGNLGVHYNYNSENNSITLYSLRKMLVFDLDRGTAYDHHSGKNVSLRAVSRNGRTYLPVDAVCDFFGLEDTYHYTQHGYLVRIKSESAWLSDVDFIDAATGPMASSLQELMAQQESQTPKPNQPPAVAPPTMEPDVTVPSEQPKKSAQICLAFRCETGEGLEQILDQLDREGYRGIFFVNSEVLAGQDALIRRVVGSGHSIGLIADGQTLSQSRQQMAQTNRMLGHVARTAATAAIVPDGQSQALEQEGWVCWKQTVDGLPRANERGYTYAQRVIRNIGSRRGTVCITLDDSQHTANVLSVLLQQMEQQEYAVIAPLETRL